MKIELPLLLLASAALCGNALAQNCPTVLDTASIEEIDFDESGRIGDTLYFAGRTAAAGWELFSLDAAGVVTLAAEFVPGPEGATISRIESVWIGGKPQLLITANTPTVFYAPWIFDGASLTLLTAENQAPYGYPIKYVSDGEQAFFTINTALGLELWVTDGTTTHIVTELNPGPLNGSGSLGVMLGDELLFTGIDPAHGAELWASDGTAAGTRLVMDLLPGPMSSGPSGMTLFEDFVLFAAEGPNGWRILGRTDGTAAGTQYIGKVPNGDVAAGLSGQSNDPYFVRHGDLFFFWGKVPFGTGIELWVTDLTEAGTHMVKDINPGPDSSYPSELTSTPFGLLFHAGSQTQNREVWITDGTEAGTHVFAELVPGNQGSSPGHFVRAGEGVYFSAKSPGIGRELFYADSFGAHLVCDIAPGATDSSPSFPVAVGSRIIYWVANSISGPGHGFVAVDEGLGLVWDLGYSGDGSRLSISSAELGTQTVVISEGHASNQLHVILYSSPVSNPSTTLMAPGSVSWIDPATFQIVKYFAGAFTSHSTTLPANPGLAGLTLNLQTASFPLGSFPATTGNGLMLLLGN